jgi:hypothetical protein
MSGEIDIVELAYEIAEVARTTSDPEAGLWLTELAKRLLEAAGLATTHDEEGGGEPPTHWLSAPADSLACV